MWVTGRSCSLGWGQDETCVCADEEFLAHTPSNVWLFDGADVSSLIDPSRRLYTENESESEDNDGEEVEEEEKQEEIGPSF